MSALFAVDPHAFSAVPPVVLYIGPDQIMPLTSVLSAIVGVVLMFWNRIVALVGRGWVMLTRRESSSEGRKATQTQPGGQQR
jgi:hypothetical protein